MHWQLTALLAMAATTVGDRVEVKDGANVVASFLPKTPAGKRGPAMVREVTVDGHALVAVRLAVAGSARAELWLGERAGHGINPLWSGIVGPVDDDGEVSRDVALGPEALELFETAARVGRCDGAPARLFRQRWDFAHHRFRPAPAVLPAPARSTLEARRGDPDMPTGRPLGGFFWTAASSTAGAHDARTLAPPSALNDGDPGTVWAVGGSDGRGEWVTARASGAGAVVGLRIGLGPELWRPRRLALLLGPGDDQRFDVELADGGRGPYWVRLPRPMTTSCMTVVIREPGPGGAPALADLDVITELDGPGGIGHLVESVRAGTDCEARVPVLVGLGAPALAPTAAAVRQGPGPGRECLLAALDRLIPEHTHDPAVAAAVVTALDRASAAEERLVLGLLPRLDPPPVEALAALLHGGRDDERERAARALAAIDHADARRALLAAAGAGSAGERASLRALLAETKALRAADVRAALEATPSPARRADLLVMLGAAAGREPAERAASLNVLRAASGDRDFEVRARAIAALGRLGGVEAAAELGRIRAETPDPVLRDLALRELAASPQPEALGVVRAALDDDDPQVRETAALALGQRRDGVSAGRLVWAAKQEPWPFVRRAEVTALGQMCAATDLLVRADERDVPLVRREALIGLAHCHDRFAPALLLRALGRRAEDPDLRALAARLLPTLHDRRVARPFAEAVGRLRVEAQAELPLEGVTVVAMQGLARVGGPDAVTAAVALLHDQRPLFRRAALEALGQLCDGNDGARAVTGALRDPDPSVAEAASAAQRRCNIRRMPSSAP